MTAHGRDRVEHILEDDDRSRHVLSTEDGQNILVTIITLHWLWRSLPYGCQHALLHPDMTTVRGRTLSELTTKKLWRDGKPTELGELVVQFRPPERES